MVIHSNVDRGGEFGVPGQESDILVPIQCLEDTGLDPIDNAVLTRDCSRQVKRKRRRIDSPHAKFGCSIAYQVHDFGGP